MGPNATAAHQQQLNEDNRQALVLFSIVIIFLISNVPRIALNIHEVHEHAKYCCTVETEYCSIRKVSICPGGNQLYRHFDRHIYVVHMYYAADHKATLEGLKKDTCTL